jgi:hypothetical protein
MISLHSRLFFVAAQAPDSQVSTRTGVHLEKFMKIYEGWLIKFRQINEK